MEHDPGCALYPTDREHSDAAKRCRDNVNLHLNILGFDAVGKFVAIRLSDGGSDFTLYDNRRDAVRCQLDEKLCAYVAVTPNGMNTCRAESFMATQRKLYDAGFRLTDPDAPQGGREVIPRLATVDQAALMRSLGRGLH